MSTITSRNVDIAKRRLAKYDRNRKIVAAKRFQNAGTAMLTQKTNDDSQLCKTPLVIGLVGLYVLICSLLYITGAIDIQKGPGLHLLAINLILMCIFIAFVFAFPWKVGCDYA